MLRTQGHLLDTPVDVADRMDGARGKVTQRRLQFVVEALRHAMGGVQVLTHFCVTPADADADRDGHLGKAES